MPRTRIIGLTITALAGVVFVIAVIAMGYRAAAYNERADFDRYRIEPTTTRTAEVHGRPVSITDATDAAGNAALRVRYGDTEILVPVKNPPAPDIPDLGGYAEWAAMLAIRPALKSGEPALDERGQQPTPRFVLVTRTTPPGFDPQSWGSVRRADWRFTFYEFMPDGTIDAKTFRWPRSDRSEHRLEARAQRGDEIAEDLVAIPPLQERTWQYQAALHVIPKLQMPAQRFKRTALEAAGWTFPVAGFAMLLLLLGLCLIFLPRKTPSA
jgi:hypothetical protein